MSSFSRLKSDNSGASLAEFSIILPLLVLFTLGIVEFSYIMWQRQQAELAVSEALRLATTRDLLDESDFDDCGPDGTVTTELAGSSCSAIGSASTWSSTCTVASANVCESTLLTTMVTEMQAIYPDVANANLQVDLYGAGLGFVGFGKPVPIVTVRLTGMTYDWILVGDIIGLGNLTMRDVTASAPAEDIN